MPRRKLSDLRVVQVPRAEEVTNNEDLSDVGSSQAPETVENVEIEAGNGQRRKSRRRTTLNELYNLPARDRVKVSRKVTSRQQQKFTHTAGSKSFARIANDETKFREKRTEYEATVSTNSSVNMDEIENQVIADVLGPERYGRVRCQGSPSQSQSSQAEINRLKQQLTQFQAEVEAREAERERREAAREAEIAAREVAYQNLQREIQEMLTMLKQNQPKNSSS